jgi:TusA-related sulfurtransferase
MALIEATDVTSAQGTSCPDRRTHAWTTETHYQGYDSSEVEALKICEVMAEIALVGSDTDEGNSVRYGTQPHKPALDIDGPVAAVRNGDDLCIWIDVPKASRDWKKFVRLLMAAGIVDARTLAAAKTSRASRLVAYNEIRSDCLDPSPLTEWVRGVGPDWNGSFDELLVTAQLFIDESDATLSLGTHHEGPVMGNPFPLWLRVPATLLNSSHNHHLYVDCPVPLVSYRKMVRSASMAGVLERGIRKQLFYRGATYLRPPWITK